MEAKLTSRLLEDVGRYRCDPVGKTAAQIMRERSGQPVVNERLASDLDLDMEEVVANSRPRRAISPLDNIPLPPPVRHTSLAQTDSMRMTANATLEYERNVTRMARQYQKDLQRDPNIPVPDVLKGKGRVWEGSWHPNPQGQVFNEFSHLNNDVLLFEAEELLRNGSSKRRLLNKGMPEGFGEASDPKSIYSTVGVKWTPELRTKAIAATKFLKDEGHMPSKKVEDKAAKLSREWYGLQDAAKDPKYAAINKPGKLPSWMEPPKTKEDLAAIKMQDAKLPKTRSYAELKTAGMKGMDVQGGRAFADKKGGGIMIIGRQSGPSSLYTKNEVLSNKITKNEDFEDWLLFNQTYWGYNSDPTANDIKTKQLKLDSAGKIHPSLRSIKAAGEKGIPTPQGGKLMMDSLANSPNKGGKGKNVQLPHQKEWHFGLMPGQYRQVPPNNVDGWNKYGLGGVPKEWRDYWDKNGFVMAFDGNSPRMWHPDRKQWQDMPPVGSSRYQEWQDLLSKVSTRSNDGGNSMVDLTEPMNVLEVGSDPSHPLPPDKFGPKSASDLAKYAYTPRPRS